MPARSETNTLPQPVRKPLYGSIWMALFAILREELSHPRTMIFSRDDSPSRRP